jgi:hypothetical protein
MIWRRMRKATGRTCIHSPGTLPIFVHGLVSRTGKIMMLATWMK